MRGRAGGLHLHGAPVAGLQPGCGRVFCLGSCRLCAHGGAAGGAVFVCPSFSLGPRPQVSSPSRGRRLITPGEGDHLLASVRIYTANFARDTRACSCADSAAGASPLTASLLLLTTCPSFSGGCQVSGGWADGRTSRASLAPSTRVARAMIRLRVLSGYTSNIAWKINLHL